MSTPRIEDSVLQQLLDDELDADERTATLRLLEESSYDQGRVRAMERLGEFVNQSAAEDAEQLSEAESSQMFASILSGLGGSAGLDASSTQAPETEMGADAAPAESDGRKRPKLRLIEGEGLGTLPPRSEKVAFEPKLSPEGLAQQKRASQPAAANDQGAKWPGLLAVVALAAAAVLALALRPDVAPPAPIAEVVAPSAPENPVVVEDEPEVMVATHLGTEVEEIDFGSNMGTVFQVPGERDVPVAVVWISDEEYVR